MSQSLGGAGQGAVSPRVGATLRSLPSAASPMAGITLMSSFANAADCLEQQRPDSRLPFVSDASDAPYLRA